MGRLSVALAAHPTGGTGRRAAGVEMLAGSGELPAVDPGGMGKTRRVHRRDRERLGPDRDSKSRKIRGEAE